MTAYRTDVARDEGPFVNPYLERALLEYYARKRRRGLVALALLVGATLLVAIGVVAFRSKGEWFPTFGFVGGPCAFGAAIAGATFLRRQPMELLDKIRTGIPIRRVRRETDTFRVRYGRSPRGISDDTPTLCVDFVDGSMLMLPSLGDLRRFSCIEYLLQVQMEIGSRNRLRAS